MNNSNLNMMGLFGGGGGADDSIISGGQQDSSQAANAGNLLQQMQMRQRQSLGGGANGFDGVNLANLNQQLTGNHQQQPQASFNNNSNALGQNLGNFAAGNLGGNNQQFGQNLGAFSGPMGSFLGQQMNAAGIGGGNLGGQQGGNLGGQQGGNQMQGSAFSAAFMNQSTGLGQNLNALGNLSQNLGGGNNLVGQNQNLGGNTSNFDMQRAESIIAAAMAAAGGNKIANDQFSNQQNNANNNAIAQSSDNNNQLTQNSIMEAMRRASFAPSGSTGGVNTGGLFGMSNMAGMQGGNQGGGGGGGGASNMMGNQASSGIPAGMDLSNFNNMMNQMNAAGMGGANLAGNLGGQQGGGNQTQGSALSAAFMNQNSGQGSNPFFNVQNLSNLAQAGNMGNMGGGNVGGLNASSGGDLFGGGCGTGAMGSGGMNGAFGAAGFAGGNIGAGGNFNFANTNLGNLGDLQQQQQQFLQNSIQQQKQNDPPKRRSSSLSSTGSLTPFERRRSSLGIFGGGNTNNEFQKLFSNMPTDSGIGDEGGTGKKKKAKGKSKAKGGKGNGGDHGGKPSQPKEKKRAKTFPEKLMDALMDHSDEEAVAWLPDGKSFVIVNPEVFCEEVLSNIFKLSKYASFVRKLHRWGFVRLTSGTGTDCFHHPLFQRGKKDLASKIICTPRADLPAGANGAVGPKDQAKLMGMAGAMGNIDSKPPSLAGVEKFIRAKVAADAAKKNKGSAKKTNESAKLGVSGNDSDSLN